MRGNLAKYCALAFAAIALIASAQAETPALRPLGIGLEDVDYPYPVHFLDLTIEGQMLRMAYMVVAPSGPANGKTVVLLHGKSFSGDYWARTIAKLSADGYRVVVPDQLGFGKSAKPDIRYNFDLLARNTKMLLDSLGVTRAAIVGHSFGGMLAVYFARDYPETTGVLVLENPIGLEDYRSAIPPQPIETSWSRSLALATSRTLRSSTNSKQRWMLFSPPGFTDGASGVTASGCASLKYWNTAVRDQAGSAVRDCHGLCFSFCIRQCGNFIRIMALKNESSPRRSLDLTSLQLPKLWLSAKSRLLSRPRRLFDLFHKIEFSILNGNLMVPAGHRIILSLGVTTQSPRDRIS